MGMNPTVLDDVSNLFGRFPPLFFSRNQMDVKYVACMQNSQGRYTSEEGPFWEGKCATIYVRHRRSRVDPVGTPCLTAGGTHRSGSCVTSSPPEVVITPLGSDLVLSFLVVVQ